MTGAWACLMYHEIPPAGAVGYFGVSSARLASQLDLLRDMDLRVVPLEHAVHAQNRDGLVALSFDDGHETHYAQAFPLLFERDQAATFFVTTDWVGRKGYATWSQLREMSDAGMSIQSHTASHPFLSELDRLKVQRELRVSKDLIEQHTGRPCQTLALPGGDAPVRWKLADYAALGFHCVATSRWGPNEATPLRDAIAVRRYTVRRDTADAQVGRLALASVPAYAPEGLRLSALHLVRATLGPTRYSRWRRRALELLARQ